MVSHPSHLIEHSTTVLVVPPSCCDTDNAPYWWFLVLELFGTFTDLVGSFCENPKSALYPYCTWMQSWPSQKTASTAADLLAALLIAQKWLMPNQPDTNLKTPTFEWTTSDQYDKFKLCPESMESWFHLQEIPDELDDKGAHLEYILNFLSTTGHWKWNQWIPAGATTDDIVATKKNTKSFLDHLAFQMDHTVSQWCQIYQFEDGQIKPGDTPDELVDHLQALANRCSIPTD